MLRRVTLATTIAATLVVALFAPVSAAEQRPFQARFTGGAVEADQRCGPNALTIGWQVSGVGTSIGRYTASGTNCTEFTLGTQAVDIWDGIILLRAADGSTLTFGSHGSQAAPSGGIAVATQTLTVTSGTGRFADAAGVLNLTSTVYFADLTTSGSVYGWLSY